MSNMYSSKLITFVVPLCLIFCAKSVDSGTINVEETNENHYANPRVSVYENENLYIKVLMRSNITQERCGGKCTVNNVVSNVTSPVDFTKCEVINEDQNTYLNIQVNGTIKKELNGKWICNFNVVQPATNGPGASVLSSSFELHVNTAFFESWMWIAIPVVLLVLLVIIGQTCCIVYYRRKAKRNRQRDWTNKKETEGDTNNTVRYSKMPGLKKDLLIPESRESGIYEVLENVRGVPPPPPVESLPRKNKIQNEVPEPLTPVESAPSTPSYWGSLRNSLLRRNKRTESISESINTASLDRRPSHERIRNRAPLPIPTEELYEAMEDSPPPVRRELPKIAEKIASKEETPAHPKPKFGVPPSTSVAHTTPQFNELKQAMEKRNRLNPIQPQPPATKPQPKPQPKDPQNTTAQPSVPKQKPWQKQPQLPKANQQPNENQWSKEPTTPKEKTWPKEPAYKGKVWSKEPQLPKHQHEESRPMGSLKPKGTRTQVQDSNWPEEPRPMGFLKPNGTQTPPQERVWPEDPPRPMGSRKPTGARTPPEPVKNWSEEPPRPMGTRKPTGARTPPEPVKNWSEEPPRPMGTRKPTGARTPPEPVRNWTEESPTGSLRSNRVPHNPGLPPPDAPPAKLRTPWGEVIPPKPRPPPPSKPIQLHPLPHPPTEPEHIHVVTEHASRDQDRESDDSDEWTYEPLPQYNIYSM